VKRLLTVLLAAGLFLSACRQGQAVYLQSCSFCADSTDTSYGGVVHWMGSSWGTKICFQDDSFAATADLTYNRFLDTAVFTDATFLSTADFSHDTFQRAVYFDDVTFAKDAHFEYARFPHYAKFTNLVTPASVSIRFDDATLPDTIDFSQNPALLCKIDLTTANFDEPDRYDTSSGDYSHPHNIFLFNTDISKFKLDYFHFRLLLPDSTITPSLGAKHQRITKDQKEAMYEALLANFKNNGQEESYKRLDIEYQQFKSHNSGAPGLAWIQQIWWNFGYSKWYVFIWVGVSLLVFSFINSGCLRVLNDQVYEVFKPGVVDAKARYGRRLWQSVIYTSNIFFRLTLDREGMKFEKLGPTLYFFFIYVLGVLCLGYLANFILQP
jgi:hypothetical protein